MLRTLLLLMAIGVSGSALACNLPHPPGQHILTKSAEKGGYWAGPAISGSWFNPDRNGEGVIVQHLDDGRVLAFWFTYPALGEAGDQAWLIAQEGVIDGDTVRFASVLRPQGARFGAAFDPAQVTLSPWGTLEMRFSDCNNASLSWVGPTAFGSGTRPLTRLTSLDEIACNGTRKLTTSGARSVAGLRARTGAWYVPSRSGEGWIVEELGDGRSVVYWFTFDPEGRQAWTVGSATRQGNRLVIEDNRIARGTHFGTAFSASAVELRAWGRLEMDFATCNSATLSYASTLPGYGSATRDPVRLTAVASARCLDSMPAAVTNASFTERARMAAPYQSEHAVAALGDSLYVVGGFGDLNGFRRYDRSLDRWVDLPDLPSGRDHPAAFAIPGSVYFAGGAPNGVGDPNTPGFRYDIATGTWEAVPGLLGGYGSHAALLHGQAYLGVGDSSLQQFDPRQRQGRIIPGDHQPRDHSQVVAFMDEIWHIGGRYPETTSVSIYDPVSEQWRPGPRLARWRGGFAAAVVGDRIVIGGGEVIELGRYVEPGVEIYNAGATTWAPGPDLPVPVHGTAAGAINGRFLIVSGSTVAGTALGNTGRVFELVIP